MVRAAQRVVERGGEHKAHSDLFSRQRAIDEEFLGRAARLFEARMGCPVDGRFPAIVDNLADFSRILAECNRMHPER